MKKKSLPIRILTNLDAFICGATLTACVILVNLSGEPFVIERGERIAQLVLAKHEVIEWEEAAELAESERGAGGFGSTGVK